jgi:hypothetical protein
VSLNISQLLGHRDSFTSPFFVLLSIFGTDHNIEMDFLEVVVIWVDVLCILVHMYQHFRGTLWAPYFTLKMEVKVLQNVGTYYL